MADNIFVRPDDLSSRDLKKIVNKAENALKKAMAAFDEGNERHSWAWGGNTYYLFNSNATDLLGSAEGKLREAKNKLDKLAKILDSGPDAMKEIDRRYKSEMKEWRKKGDHSKVIWTSSGGKTGSEEVPVGGDFGDSDYPNYRKRVDVINKQYPKGAPQDSGGWQCTWAATATMLNRRQVREGKEPSFTRDSVFESNHKYYPQTNGYGIYYAHDYRSDAGEVYSTKYEFDYTIEENMSTQGCASREEYIANLLLEHPEGVVIFNNQHAIVITDFEYTADGGYQFFADDPVNTRNSGLGLSSTRIPVDDTYQSGIDGKGNVINNAKVIWYIE